MAKRGGDKQIPGVKVVRVVLCVGESKTMAWLLAWAFHWLVKKHVNVNHQFWPSELYIYLE
jgi:hypothetical protein